MGLKIIVISLNYFIFFDRTNLNYLYEDKMEDITLLSFFFINKIEFYSSLI